MDVYHVINENDALYKCLTKNKQINLEVVVDIKSELKLKINMIKNNFINLINFFLKKLMKRFT